MNRERISAILIILFVIASSGWLVITTKKMMFLNIDPNTPDGEMSDVYLIQMNESGKPNSILKTKKLTSYNNLKKAIAINPVYTIFRKNMDTWHVKSDRAESADFLKTVNMIGHVNILELPGNNSLNVALKTSKLTVYPKKSFGKTDQVVTLNQTGNSVSGVGFTANMKTGKMNILKQTSGNWLDKTNNRK
jgi:lipopolysaccharide export system protein LptC